MFKTIEASDLGIVNRLLAGNLRVSIWTARKKLTPKDLGDAELPPDELASLGSKKICDPAALKIFHTLKARAIGVLDRYGLEFLGGWAIPESKAMEAHRKLEAIETEFNEAKEEFLLNYNQNVQDWIDRHVEWSSIIEDSVESADYVRSRISFQSRFFSVAMPGMTGEGADVFCDGFHEEVAGLGKALFDDVAQAATEAWRFSFKGQEKVSHKALSPIRKVYDKLESFSFVDPIVLPITEIIKATLDILPKRGYIEGLPLIQLQGLVSLLRDTEALADLAERRMNGLATDDILAGFIPAEMVQVAEPEEEQNVESNLELTPPPAAAVQADQAVTQGQTESSGQMVGQQAANGQSHHAPAPSGNDAQPSLLDYPPTLFPDPASQAATSPESVPEPAMAVTAAAEPASAPVITVEKPALQASSEEPAPLAVPVIAATPATQSGPFQSEDDTVDVTQPKVVIPVTPGGMGDFLNGFI